MVTKERHANHYAKSSQDQSSKEELYVQLEQAISEAEKEKSKAFEESMRRMKAEKASVRAMRRVIC